MRLRNLIPCNVKLTLRKSGILPHLTCFHLVWNFCKSSESRKIERVQERTLRAIYKSKTESHEELLTRSRPPTLYNRHLKDTATRIYKVKNNLVQSCLLGLLETRNSQYCLRNCDFEILRFNTTSYGKHTRHQGPYIWSKLSKELRMSPLRHLRPELEKLTLQISLTIIVVAENYVNHELNYFIL